MKYRDVILELFSAIFRPFVETDKHTGCFALNGTEDGIDLAEQNVRVIAVSADKTQQRLEKKLACHQWPDKYCDFSGMAGEHFTSYGVVGVPTQFLLDRVRLTVP